MTEILLITSRDNQKLKHVRRVRDGHEKGEVFVEGSRLTKEAIRSGVPIMDVFVEDSFFGRPSGAELSEAIAGFGCKIHKLPENIFRTITDTLNSQGIILLAKRPPNKALEDIEIPSDSGGSLPLTLFLDRVNNPSNLGAIARTAEAAGVRAMLVSENSADPFSSKSLRASMGSAFRIPIVVGCAWEDVMRWADSKGFITTAADAQGGLPYTAVDWTQQRILIFGSEAQGLAVAQKGAATELIYIPMQNGVESLNLAVSCAVVLFEARRHVNGGGQ